jgi:hypothetical protein
LPICAHAAGGISYSVVKASIAKSVVELIKPKHILQSSIKSKQI